MAAKNNGISDDMKRLLAHQLEIKTWLLEVMHYVHFCLYLIIIIGIIFKGR